jgi:hypothetical protein
VSQWYEVDAAVNGASITFAIEDGAQGDDDLTINGVITDEGGPAAEAQENEPIPALGTAGLLLLATLLGLAAVWLLAVRRVCG